jgi:hypothetical protein
MTFLSRLLGFLAVLLVVRLVLRAVAAWLRASAPARIAATDLVRDRVCNTFVPRDRALPARIDGKDEHFCSAACRDRALAEAAQAS